MAAMGDSLTVSTDLGCAWAPQKPDLMPNAPVLHIGSGFSI